MSINSLDAYLEFMTSQQDDDIRIYEHLARLDIPRISTLLARLQRVEAVAPPRGRGAASFRSRQSDLKGRLYEKVIAALVHGVKCFETYSRVASSTNEIDLLIALGPSASFVPALRHWSTHCICECKFHTTYVQNDWVSKLNTVLQTHGTPVGLLFSRKGIAAAGNGAKIRNLLQLLANSGQPAFILCLDWDDLMACVNGENFLKLVSQRFVEVRTGSRKLGLLAS